MSSFEKNPNEHENDVPPHTSEVTHEEPQEGSAELQSVAQEISASESGLVNRMRQFINSKVEEQKLPTNEGLGFESTMGIYGGKLVHDDDGRLVFDTRGFWSKIDQWGDRILRSFDDHHAKNPGAMFARRPIEFLKLLPFIVDSKRFRGSPEQTRENITRLGLDEYYGIHPWGVEIKKPEILSHSIGLQDIFRQDQINHPAINNIDRFDALGRAAFYMKNLHETSGGIAEGNAYNFIFTETDGTIVDKPILMMPVEIYNPDKNISEIEQRATDMLDFLASGAIEEYRRTSDWESVKKVLNTALESYGSVHVAKMVASYVRRGRLTLPNDTDALDYKSSPMYKVSRHVFAAHNTQRLTVKNHEITAQLRNEIINACEAFADSHVEKSQE